MDNISLTTLLLFLVVFIILSAFFSISETSMMAINRYRLKHLAQTGHRGAKLTSQLLQKVDRLLSVVLLGSSLVNAAAASVVTVIAIRLFGNHEWAITLGALVLTFLLLVFSEITPKIIGASYPEKIAFPASFVLSPLLQAAKPVIWFVNLFVHSLLWLRIIPDSVFIGIGVMPLAWFTVSAFFHQRPVGEDTSVSGEPVVDELERRRRKVAVEA